MIIIFCSLCQRRHSKQEKLLSLVRLSKSYLFYCKPTISLSDDKDKRVVEVLHRLIVTDAYANCRGTFVYCLLDFSSTLSFELAFDLLINGNFEVAHHAFEIIDSIDEDLRGEKVADAFKSLTKLLNDKQDIED